MSTTFPVSRFKEIETPFYYYDLSRLRETLSQALAAAGQYGYILHYALKANANDRVLSIVAAAGYGADCVSGNEVTKAIETGFPRSQVVFAGVGKSDQEIKTALAGDIFCFNSESIQELEVINQLAGESGRKAKIALRINPNVDAKTHKYITTGIEENKFGINPWEWESVLAMIQTLDHLELTGLHFHIGSQITRMEVFKGLCSKANEILRWFHNRGFSMKHINLGGGLGIDYSDPDGPMPDFTSYFGLFHKHLDISSCQEVHFEPGRALVAQSGTLISRVLYIKEGVKTRFAILDAGMTELIRPALYQAYHKIQNLSSNGMPMSYDVVGPICESSDCFGKAVSLPATNRGDLIAIRSAGAYGEVMSSGYNLRDKAKSYYSDEIDQHE